MSTAKHELGYKFEILSTSIRVRVTFDIPGKVTHEEAEWFSEEMERHGEHLARLLGAKREMTKNEQGLTQGT